MSIPARVKLEDEPKEKRRKVEKNRQSDHVGGNVQPAAGIIGSMRIQNFMCHENLAFDFNTNLNFVIGPNGSGKSAVLTALQVALGAAAKSTERGSSIGDLVKKGCNTASVSVTLRNTGPFAFEPELLGDSITIVRTLRTNGTGDYKILNSSGRVIGHNKEWIERITNALNISINNPMCILTQNTAKTFLSTCKPKDLYKFFTSATLLDEIKSYLETALRERKSLVFTVERKETMVEEMKDEMQEKKKQYNAAKNLFENSKKLLDYKKQLLWAVVADSDAEIKRIGDDIQNKETATEGEKAAIENIDRVIANVTGEMEKIAEGITEAQKEMDRLQIELEQGGTILARAIPCFRDARVAHTSSKKALDRKKGEINSLNEEINKIRATDFSDVEKKRKQTEEEVLKLQSAVEAYNQQKSTADNDMQQFKAAKDRALKEVETFKHQINQLEQEIRKKVSDIERLSGGDRDPISVFGKEYVSLARDIQARNLGGKIKGPIGAFVKVKDNQWAPAISCALGGEGNLISYVVDSDATSTLLRSLMRKHGFTRIPNITATRFLGRQHDVSEVCVQLGETTPMKTLLDEIICEDPDVMNILIDSQTVYATVLIETDEIAKRYMSNQNYVPKGCRVAYTKGCDTYYPDPDYRTYPNRASRQTYLQQTMEDFVDALRTEVGDLNVAKNDLVSTIRVHQSEALSNGRLEQEAKARMIAADRHIRSSQITIESMKRTLAEDLTPDVNILSYQDDLRDAEEALEALKMEEEEKEAVHAAAEQAVTTAKEKVATIESEIQKKTLLNQPFSDNLAKVKDKEGFRELESKLENSIRTHERRRQKHADNIVTLQNEKKGLEAQKKAAETNKAKRKAEALDKCEDKVIEPSASSKKLTSTISSLQNVIDKEKKRQNIEDIEALLEGYHKVMVAYNQAKKDVDEMKANLNRAMREEEYRRGAFTSLRQSLAVRVTHATNATLSCRGFFGEPIIDFKLKEFNLRIAPKEGAALQSIATLSGGERSFSTLALVLAMWQVIDQPFRIMDEFDVYMDGINRQMSIDFIKSEVDSRRDRQFILITPLGVDMQENQFLGIHKMHAPRP